VISRLLGAAASALILLKPIPMCWRSGQFGWGSIALGLLSRFRPMVAVAGKVLLKAVSRELGLSLLV